LWDEVKRKEAKDFLEVNIEKENFYELLKTKYPEIESYLADEAYLAKKNMLLDQINNDLNSIPESLADQDKTEWRDIVQFLKDILESDLSDQFEGAWMEYIDFRVNKLKNGQ
jgi:hypothetical protein